MSYGLELHPRISSTSRPRALAFTGDLTAVARNWRRSSRAIGGYWLGSFTLSQEDMTRAELQEFYNLNVGCRLIERTYGMVSWEGYIVEMRYAQDGSEFGISLWPETFTNRVVVYYSDDIGSRQVTAQADNTDSQAEFGVCARRVSVAGTTSTGAEALRDRMLAEYAWPRSRERGSLAITGEALSPVPDQLEITVAGYWATLNWGYRATSGTNAASALVSALVGASEFVTAGRIETNSLSVRVDCYPLPRRRGDLIEEITQQGDSSGNLWKCGVYGGRELVYEQAPAVARYQHRAGELLDIMGTPVVLSMMEPGFLVYNANAPAGWAQPGVSSAWDDPRVSYCEEVEFIAPDELLLKFGPEDQRVSLIEERVRAGNI